MTALVEIRFPDDQQEGTEASITRWLVAEGDEVAAHDPVAEIETDKVVIEIAAPEAGRIAEIKIPQDEEINPGDVLCTLDTTSADNPAGDTPETNDIPTKETGQHTERDRLSPAVRQRAMQHDLDLSGMKGSGRNGRITLQDIEGLIEQQKPTTDDQPGLNKHSPPVRPSDKTDIIAHDKMRKRIADNMVASLLHTAPHVTAVFEADLGAVFQHRKTHKAAFENAGTPLTLTAYFVAAAIAGIQKVPQVNSRWFDDHLEIFHHINMGIGTALGDEGLIVPVIHDVQKMDLKSIATQLADITRRAREKALKPADVRDGTFTISNHGVSGSLFATPIIINQPQSAILGVGKIEKRIKIREIDGQDVITIRPMCYVSLTIDHRVLDGYQTNAFLSTLVDTLETWS